MRSWMVRSGGQRGRPVRGAVVLGTMVALVLSGPPASAHYLWNEDGDDTSSSFDLKGVRLFQKFDPARGFVRARTYETIDLGEGPLLTVYIDSRGGSRADRSVSAIFDGGSSGYICLGVYHLKRDDYVGDCELRHAKRLWQITFAWNLLDATRHVRWWVVSNTSQRENPEFTDRAPGAGWFEH